MSSVTGTFSGTGASSAVLDDAIDVMLRFVGTASVDVEVEMPSGNWIKIETGITADYHKVFESAAAQNLRVNCTAHTDDVEYAIKKGDKS